MATPSLAALGFIAAGLLLLSATIALTRILRGAAIYRNRNPEA